ncbi:UNVERIFIED_CONTAM: hypothetical protein GTU68_045097 [Idotea baltica]|nr:hypothetical protein [Idotea baltica]
MFELRGTSFDPSEALSAFTLATSGAGAIVCFTGLVRSGPPENPVTNLHLQAYSPMTERGIEHAIVEASERWQLTDVLVIHRVGDMAPEDPIVFVAAASAHRRTAFEAVDFLMDYLKTRAVFWKKETTLSGEAWIEPRSEDYADADRWQHRD